MQATGDSAAGTARSSGGERGWDGTFFWWGARLGQRALLVGSAAGTARFSGVERGWHGTFFWWEARLGQALLQLQRVEQNIPVLGSWGGTC